MAANEYHFVTHWRVQASVERVMDVLSDATDLPRWWPSVYLDVREIEAGNASGIGKRVALHTKGWLPYTLRWQFVVTDVSQTGFALRASGDFDGRGVWAFAADGEYTNITYDWHIAANKPLLKRLSPLLKPVFARNHEWAMRQGELSLNRELARLRVSAAHS
jgi:hypothetical protein